MNAKLLDLIKKESELTDSILIIHPITGKPTNRKVYYDNGGAYVRCYVKYYVKNAKKVDILTVFIVDK